MRNSSNSSSEKSLDYVQCVNRAINYVLDNLAEPLQLEKVAEVAGYSAFHFHRIFRSLVGESLSDFVKRVRLERAVSIMSRKDWNNSPSKSLTAIAFDCGFSSSSDFSRCFKQRYGVSPSEFDVARFRATQRERWQEAVADPEHVHLLKGLQPGENPDRFEVELRELPRRRVAYIRVIDSYRDGVVLNAVNELMSWADQRGLADGQWLGYMWDDPEIVPHEKCRYDVGLEIPMNFIARDIDVLEFAEMTVAQVEIRGGIDLEMRAIDWLFKTWLPHSGFLPSDLPAFEAWIGRPFAHGYEHFEINAQLPIQRP